MLLYGTEDRWDEIKTQILSYAETRPDWLMQFFDNNISADNDADDRTFVKFLRDLGTANAWGGEHCIGIACRLFKINIWTFSHSHWETHTHRNPIDSREKSTSTWAENALVGGDVAGQPYALLIYKNANHYHAAVRSPPLPAPPTARVPELTSVPFVKLKCEFTPASMCQAPLSKSPPSALFPSYELLGKPVISESVAPPRLSAGITGNTQLNTHCLSLPPISTAAGAQTPQFTAFLAPDVPPTPKLKSMPFSWTAVKKQILFDCYREAGRVCKGEALKVKLLAMFQAHYPDFKQTPGTLQKRYFDFFKERERSSCPASSTSISTTANNVTQLRRKKSIAKFAWTDESKQCLSGLVAETTATVPRNAEVWPEVLRRFRSIHPECALADNSIRTRFYDIKKGAQISAGDNPVLIWQSYVNTFLIDCAQRADAEDRLNRTLFMSQGRAGGQGSYLKLVARFFQTKYPDFTANQIISQLYHLKFVRLPIPSTPASSMRLEDIMKYWQYGHDISTRPLFEALCFNCSRMIRKKEHRRVATFEPNQPLENEETLESTVPIEQHYDAAYLADVNYAAMQDGDGLPRSFYVCERCRKVPDFPTADNPLKLFGITKFDRAKLLPEPDALRCLNGYVKGQIQPCGLFSVRIKKASGRIFEHRRGEVNILPKLASHYMDLFAIMFEKEPAAIREDEQAGDERRMTQSAVDQLTIKNAVLFLREHNHLFKSLYAQCETLYGFVPNEGVQSVKIVGGLVPRPADPKKTAAEVVGEAEEMVLLAPHGEIAAADHPMDEVNYGIVHPKNSGVPEMVRVAYGSEYLEEKVWAHIFWQGTGGFYPKTAAAAGWSRRDYVKYRLLMLHPAFRDEPAWIFYQTDQLIKEQILNYNMNTVKVADLVNPLSKEDIERQEKDPYKRFGTNMPANLPNSRPFMSSKCLDLKAMAKLLGEPARLITLTQNDDWLELLACTQPHEMPGERPQPRKHDRKWRKRSRTIPTSRFDPKCTKEDPKLKEKITELKKIHGVHFPVEMVEAFCQRFEGFMDRFIRTENNVFGRVRDWWYRMEYQKRGGIHIHMVIWWDEETAPNEQKISAEMPRFKDPNDSTKPHPMNDLWREAVLQTQIHHCFDSRCLRGPGGTRLQNCKYGFPFALCSEERLDKMGIRYEYLRSDIEDVSVSPYVLEPSFVLARSRQRSARHQTRLEMYLAKYIAKCETAEDIQLVKTSPALVGKKRVPPSNASAAPANGKDDSASAQPVLSDQADEPPPEKVPYDRVTKDDSDVKRFLKLRVVNILEAVMLCFGYPQVGCSRQIIFLPIDIVPVSRVVKRKKHREADKGDSPYYDTKLDKYFLRSELLEDVTYQQYFEQYYVKYDKKLAPQEPDDYARDDEEETMRKDNPTFFVDQTAVKRKWVRRANPARYAVVRFRYFAPHGNNVESYCLIKLLRAKPARRSTVEGWIAEFGSYLSACIHLGLVEKGAEDCIFSRSVRWKDSATLRLREWWNASRRKGGWRIPTLTASWKLWLRATRQFGRPGKTSLHQAAADAAEKGRKWTLRFLYTTDKWEQVSRHITFAKCATTALLLISSAAAQFHNFLGMDFEFKSRIQHGTFQAKALSDTQVVFVDEVSNDAA
ncbi:hypothetical protein BV898_19133 [Hypsibius exemplaris]|uniref:Helitron helicase-like domain-containing protein n=1 Tax=Hypsibius exemplaris TaxID=2072580 RepID=A0A9X6NKW9_HYPEX|nr:hypothetical protein BV898_19133 [Hypsibius exemplaris]